MPMASAASGLTRHARLMGGIGPKARIRTVILGGKRTFVGWTGCGLTGIGGLGTKLEVRGRGDTLASGVGALGSGRMGLRELSRWGVERFGVRGRGVRWLATQGKKDGEDQPKKKSPLKDLLSPSIKHENIYTLPNILTFSRLLAAPLVGYLLIHPHYTAALGLFVYAGVTDLVDGWIARRWNLQTVVGTVIDPMADKALMTVVVGVLGWKGILPLPLTIIILGRDVLLSLAAFYYRYISLPPPRTFARYWDFSLPSAEVKPTAISKVNTFLQLGLIGGMMTGLAFPELMGEGARSVLEGSWWVVGGTTVWSGASYLGKGGVRILGKKG